MLLDTEPLQTTKLLTSFLCSVNFYRNEIPKYSELTAEWYEMAALKKRFCTWSESTLAIFTMLKKALSMAPILAFPNFDLPFVIQCDASKRAVGGVCLQNQGKLRPVTFFGRKLNSTEKRYSATELELLAVVYGYSQFYHLVYGHNILYWSLAVGHSS